MNYTERSDKMSFSIRMSKEEKELAKKYARFHSMSLSEAFKKALFERIEEDLDIVAGEKAYDEYLRSGKKKRPIEELWEELDI